MHSQHLNAQTLNLSRLQLLLAAAHSYLLSSLRNEHWHFLSLFSLSCLHATLINGAFTAQKMVNVLFFFFVFFEVLHICIQLFEKVIIASAGNCSHKYYFYFFLGIAWLLNWNSFHTLRQTEPFNLVFWEGSRITSHPVITFSKITKAFWQGQSVKMPLTPLDSCWDGAKQGSASEPVALADFTSSRGPDILAPLRPNEMC